MSARLFGHERHIFKRVLAGWKRRPHRRRIRRHSRLLEALEPRVVLDGAPVISEFLAVNDNGLEDEDGNDPDWIEIYNPSDATVSLERWSLTDDQGNLAKWRFPNVEIGAGEYLVVFASGKDRKNPEEPLHTSFQLASQGEFLALVQPDGTIASQFAPQYPRQVSDVSYGIPTGLQETTLVGAGATAQVHIPTNGNLDVVEPDAIEGTWLDPALDDQGPGWFSASSGIGYVVEAQDVTLADSVADFSGVQGQDNWFYGVWSPDADPDKTFSPNEFVELSPTVFRTDTNKWDMAVNGAPVLEITPEGGQPSSGFFTQWAIRRWVSETVGRVTIRGQLANADSAGDGVAGQILHNGQSIYRQVVNGSSEEYSVTVEVGLGDTIDFIIDAVGSDAGDQLTFTATMVGKEYQPLPNIQMASSEEDWSSSGEQGVNGWYYGYVNRSTDADGTYQPRDFTEFPAEFWSRNRFDWPAGNPPNTQISRTTVVANGANSGPVHWAVRRWVSNFDGRLSVNWTLAKSRTGGDGVTGRVFHNGVEVDAITISGDDRTGVQRTVEVPGVRQGDIIDLVLDPTGVGGDPANPEDTSDSAVLHATMSRVPLLQDDVQSSIQAQMHNISSSAYLRFPFQVENPSQLDTLMLHIKYDDGFVAYLNGQPVANGNAPEVAGYNSTALTDRTVVDATATQSFDLGSSLSLLRAGENVLQIHALNADAGDGDLLVKPELVAGSLTARLDQARYFPAPTPGAENGLGAEKLGPLVYDLAHAPHVPRSDQPLVITAHVQPTFADIATVQLHYRVMYDEIVTVAMVDNGTGGDQRAGDGIFTATLPAGLAASGQMIRWFVTSLDTEGRQMRAPRFESRSDSEEYRGTVVLDSPIDSGLPVFHWFAEDHRRSGTQAGTRGSLFFDGEFYDNVLFDLHGQSSSGFPTQKKSMDVDFPSDHRFRWQDTVPRMKDINLLTNFADKSKLRNTLGYEQRKFTGSGYHLAWPVRVELNGEFYAVYDFVEDADDRWLERLGMDENGALYKMYNSFDNPRSGAEKKTRRDEPNDDLAELMNGLRLRGEERQNFIFDNVNLAAMANYLAGFVITSNRDCCHKNYYAFHDTNGTGEWWFLPWDVDLSNGRNWGGFGLAYFDDTMYPDNGLFLGDNNRLISALYQTPGFRDMYLRRLRTLIDEYVQKPGTPYNQLWLETRIDELQRQIGADAALDNEKHPARWGQIGFQPFEQAIDILKNEYAKPRRDFLFLTQVVPDDSDVEVIVSGDPGATMAQYLVPTDNALGTRWTGLDFDDSSWQSGATGIGFEGRPPGYNDLIRSDVGPEMTNRTSVFIRIPFTLESVDQIEALTLRMKYDDGYVAYLNGTEVTRQRVPDGELTIDVDARSHSDRQAVEFENINISDFISQLRVGRNVLAIHGVNSSPTSDDFLMLPELVNGLISNSRGQIPRRQVGNPKIDFGQIEFQPASQNQDEEYVELVNNNEEAVDLSGWKLQGEIEHTFEPGTVLLPGAKMYVTPSAKAFRARGEAPTGGMGLFVQGNYRGRLSNRGGTVQLVGANDELVSTLTYVGQTTPVQEHLRITEVMYHPTDPTAAEKAAIVTAAASDFEYIELVNTSSSQTLDLNGVRFTRGVSFDFTNSKITQLGPGEYVLVVRNEDAFAARYGTAAAARVAGVFANVTGLSNGGETLELLDATNSTVSEFRYDDDSDAGWPVRADGNGSSLQIIDPNGDYTRSVNWRASREIGGSPGQPGSAAQPGLVINEVLSNTDAPMLDAIELYNPTGAAISLSDAVYFLSDSADRLTKFRLPAGVVPAGGYLVLDEQDFNPTDGASPNDFGLSGSRGDEVYLTVGDGNGPRFFVDDVSFGAAAAGESFGRTPNGTGSLAPMKQVTLGQGNSDVRVGPVIISEVNYHPLSPGRQALTIDPHTTEADLEYVEIHNPTQVLIDLTDWQIRGGVDYDFEPGSVLRPQETLVVLAFDPQGQANKARLKAFKSHYGLGEDVTLLGPFEGNLNNSQERVTLLRPELVADDAEEIPRLIEDEVIYADTAQWPAADGSGSSLTRGAMNGYGNLASSWSAATPSPGQVQLVSGDLDGDGQITSADIDRLCNAIRSGQGAFDFNGDGQLGHEDLGFFVQNVLGTTFGDANLDGQFNSADLVLLFQAGEYEDGVAGNSTWAEGDWNCDGEFTSKDLIAAFRAGNFVLTAEGQPARANDAAQIGAALAELAAHPEEDATEATVPLVGPSPVHKPRAVDLVLDQLATDFDSPRSFEDDGEPTKAQTRDELFQRLAAGDEPLL